MARYEGWKNAETWQAAFFIINNERILDYWLGLAPSFDLKEFARVLKEIVPEQAPWLLTTRIDWHEIAEELQLKAAEIE